MFPKGKHDWKFIMKVGVFHESLVEETNFTMKMVFVGFPTVEK